MAITSPEGFVGRTATRRVAGIAIAFGVTLFAPVTAGAATSSIPTATRAGSAVEPVGQVQAVLLTPDKSHQSSKSQPHEFRTKDPAALHAAKLAAGAASPGRATASPTSTPTTAALFNGLNSPGLSAADEGYQPTPPDSTGAIGPTRYLEFVNNLVGVYDRGNLALLSSTDLGTFTAVPSGLSTSDPQIQWDPQGNRWLYGAVAFNSTLNNDYLLFGWSKTADPSDLTGGWCRYASPVGANLPDYPKLGHDANFVTFGTNVYDGSKPPSFPFVTADIWAIAKPPATQSTCTGSVTATHFGSATHVLKNSDGTSAFTPVPANTADASANGYIVAAHDPSVTPQSKVMVWHVAPGPVLVADGDISVGSSYSVPPSVPQPGTSYLLDSLDGRLTQAVAHVDPSVGVEAVWTQHTVAGSGRSMVRWYELLPGSLTVRQQGHLASPTDFYWNAAISPSAAGSDAMISYNRGSSSLLPVIGAQTRTSSTPLGQMDAGEMVLGSSSAADQETAFQNNCNVNPCRWGDYSGATPDPINPGVVWGSNQITGAAFLGFAQWMTQNFAITTGGVPPTPPATPTGLSASGVDASHISLSWTASARAASYKIQRSPDGSTGWAQVGTSSATSFTDSGLNPTTTYFYRVFASNSAGDSGPSSVASGTTLLPVSQAPQGNWVGTYGADGYALLGWNSSTDLVSLPLCSIVLDQGYRYQWAAGTSAVQALESPDTSTRNAAVWTDLNQVRFHLSFPAAYKGTLHLYAVDWDSHDRREIIRVNDGSGSQTAGLGTDFNLGAWVNVPINVAAGGTVSVTVTMTAGQNAVLSGVFLGGAPPAPAPPTGLTASVVDASDISLSWKASSGAGSYKIQRSPDGVSGWTQVGTSTTTSFADSGLNPSTTYYYRVIASNSAADSGPSNVASATTAAKLTYTQAPQGNWVGTYGADGYALLGWNSSTDMVSLPLCSIVLDQGYRYQWAAGTSSLQALESPDTTTRNAAVWTDLNQLRFHLTFPAAYKGTLHLYAVDWDSHDRREIITVNDGSGPQIANLSTDFNQGAWVSAPINVAAGGTVTITVTQTAGQVGVLSGVFLGGAPPPPAPPTGLTASVVDASDISLSWKASSGAGSYKIQRSPDGVSGWTQVGTSSTTSFTDGGLNPSTTYYYRVLASNSVGDSGPSNVASATTAAKLTYTQAPQGNWVGTYGADGYALLGWNSSTDMVSLPLCSIVLDQGYRYQWAAGTTAIQALESPDTSTRNAAVWTDLNQLRFHLTFPAAYKGTLHLYAVDWDSHDRREIITVNDGSGPQIANLSTDFNQGAWVSAPINVAAGGTVTITVTQTAGQVGVLSGVFLGGAPPPPAAPTGLSAAVIDATDISLNWTTSGGAGSYKIQRSPDGISGWTQVGTSSTTSFTDGGLNPSTTYYYRVIASNSAADSGPSNVASATTAARLTYTQAPQGNWVGTYGVDGYALLGWNSSTDMVSLPLCSIVLDQGYRYQWAAGTSSLQALESPDTTTRNAAVWTDLNQLRFHLSFPAAYKGTLHLYAVDWDSHDRREIITVNDGSGPQIANLSTDFNQGAWVSAPINVAAGGTVTITVTRTAGQVGVISGLFLG